MMRYDLFTSQAGQSRSPAGALRRWGPVGFCLGVLLAVGWLPSQAWAVGTTQVIAQTGDAPPVGDGTFDTLETPILNDSGQVAFHAGLIGTAGSGGFERAIYRADGSTLTQMEREASSLLGASLTDLSTLRGMDRFGRVLYTITIDNLSILPTPQVRLSDGASPPTIIAAVGDNAVDSQGQIDSFSGIKISPSSQVAIHAGLVNTPGGASDRTALYVGSGGPLTRIIRTSQPAPNGNGVVTEGGFFLSGLNNAGQATFRAGTTGAGFGGLPRLRRVVDTDRRGQPARPRRQRGATHVRRLPHRGQCVRADRH